ncbi:hypothetical protein BKA65DRAFT_279266 [Rhexocercosporidium sp. MPI-PUGE-AT-0058]|nr:hypothetical protein BKA65DRAFT_279266 [Rhexocercosporidium sp. MPI-PUGE-AT-0058]
MDAYNSSCNTDDQDEEPYHCTPAYDEEDIVCLGSDTEEAAEEIAKKHRRYEVEAQRCNKGQLPILQSASLKGPFETGWVNPWRYRPTKKQDEDWWQPGSEDMLFTRAKVMERAAAYGLGYLQPADALRWCKATAQAEAEIINETNIQSGQILTSVELDDLVDSEDVEDSHGFSDSDQPRTKHRPYHSDSARSLEHPEFSMLNHYSKTPDMNELENRTKVTKRPADSQWLKGSYVSKRSRWEGPAVPSPTPHPDVLERGRRRRQLSTRAVDKGRVQTHKPSRLSKSFPDSTPKKVPQHFLAPVRDPITPREFAEQSDLGAISTFDRKRRTSRIGREDFGHQPDDIDELQDSSQEALSRPAPKSSVKFRKTQVSINDRSFSDLEPDDLVVIAPRTKPESGTALIKTQSSDIHISIADPDDSYNLPELPRKHIASHEDNEGEDIANEDSFITEVAPSSRNLEKFEFRKRRPKFSWPWKDRSVPGPDGDRRSIGSDAQSHHPHGQYEPFDDIQDAEQHPAVCDAPSQEPLSSFIAPPVDERLVTSSQATPPRSDRSGASWDTIQDITQDSSFGRAAKAPQTTSPPKSKSSTSASPFTTPKKRSARSLVSSHTNHLLLNSLQSRRKFQIGAGENQLPVGSNDMSTQSFNTTPPRSIISTARQPLPVLREHTTQHPETEASSETLKTTAMDKIQLALSQACPSSSQGDSIYNNSHRDLQEEIIGNALSSKRRSLDVHLIGGHGTTGSLDFHHRSQEGGAPGLPDIEFTEFANESFLFLGEYLSEPVQPAAPIAFGHESEAMSPAIILELQSPMPFDDLPQGEDASAEHSRITDESIQFSKEITPSTNIIPEPETRQPVNPAATGGQDEAGFEGEDRNARYTPSGDESDRGSEVVPKPGFTPSEPRASDNSACAEIQDEAELERDHWRLNPTRMHQKTSQGRGDLVSGPIDMLKRENELPMGAEMQIAQDEANKQVVGRYNTQTSVMIDQANKECQSEPGIIADAIAVIERHAQSNDSTASSEASWQGCGPQSPWATEKIEPLQTSLSNNQLEAGSLLHGRQEEESCAVSIEQDNGVPVEEMSWITMERPTTPDTSYIKPFKDFSTPTPSPERRLNNMGSNSMDTQSLINAMRNPWTGNSKTRSSAKPRKRVSFGIMPLDEEKNSQQVTTCGANATPCSPPPARAEDCSQEDIFRDGTTITTTFSKHFAAATRRHFKRILPEIRGSQLDSSPALLGAQAEAFIAADHKISADKWASSDRQTPSRYLKTRNDTNSNTNIWNEIGEDDTMLGNSFSRSPSEKVSRGQISCTGFDMAAALGEAGDFLEDWSVDTALKQAVDTEPSKHVDSNGMRRRRLFGLV